MNMNLDKKFTAFLEIANVLNKHNIVPVIYGSLGLYRIVGQLDEINDIDIIIPNENLIDNFEVLKRAMDEVGYKQDAHYPHEFTKGEGQIGFEPESDLKELGIDSQKLKVTKLNDSKFKELEPKDYLLVYRRNLKTWETKVEKIKRKIQTLEKISNN